MDKDDIRSRIARLREQVHLEQDEEQAFAAALREADSVALSALGHLRDTLLSFHRDVPEAELLGAPRLLERSGLPEGERTIESPALWHRHIPSPDPDFWRPLSPRLDTELLGMITHDPLREEWRCERVTGENISREAIVDAYADRLAIWVVHVYPTAKRRREEGDRAAAAEARNAEEKALREAEFDAYIARTPNEMALGCVGIVAGIVVLLVVLNLVL